jgi:hypothetical protein
VSGCCACEDARHNPETKFYSREKLSKNSEAIVMAAGFIVTDLARWRSNSARAEKERSHEEVPPVGSRARFRPGCLAAIIGASSADAAPMAKKHHHHHHHHYKHTRGITPSSPPPPSPQEVEAKKA